MPHLDPARLRLPSGPRADLALAGIVLVLVGIAEGQRLGSDRDATASVIASWLLAAAVCGALPLRRRHPSAVGWWTVLGTGLYYLLSTVDGPLVVIPVAVLHALSARGRVRVSVALAAVMVLGVGAGVLAGTGDVNGTALFMLTGWLIAVIALGAMRHGRVAYAEEEARLRATRERLRIARELHDVIGHNMSMIHVQASSALHRMRKDPAVAEEALTAIKQGSKEGLRELRATLGVLRQVDEEAPTAPAPGLSGIDDLVTSAAGTGLDVRVERAGTPRPLPTAVDLAAYRIVQESLTNAVRHSGARHVVVRVHHGDRELTLAVVDDGRGGARTTGSGIAGMTERARALGGTLSAGPEDAGGFGVRARLPFADHHEPIGGAADDQDPAGG
ncbi:MULTISPECIES: sensor histidine kinase [unclassified Streptomyces]|uniref:sensor histidine kinase n=1 Tax=unclassified Streptomyces TaxID=2593676 RepID=UPI000DBA50AB|nr:MULTISPECIES: sensor histidine kinase [unclassified Streptomyces]MYT75352.1 sensor histidine kinase [Streptomyces sp. SID8367]RAJ86754.1 signal transduction histidine kinase [Streptomyces sp. PsTaAH-137]